MAEQHSESTVVPLPVLMAEPHSESTVVPLPV
jgi:hypothetical protein